MSFTFAIPLTAKMAPTAKLLAYYVRTNGEIVTDSISFNVAGVFQNQVLVTFFQSNFSIQYILSVQLHIKTKYVLWREIKRHDNRFNVK